MPKAVIYPSSIKTEREKLFACYSLIEQMRLEHNRVSQIASADPKRYIETGKFRAYAQESKARLKQLLHERNALMEKIRSANYMPEQWRQQIGKLSPEEYDAVHESLFGNKAPEKAKPTEATSPLLDELKALDIDSLSGKGKNDPIEDFTTYTEEDPNSHISKTSSKVTLTDIARNEDAYVYKDKGSAHFDGDFEHRLKYLLDDSSGINSTFAVWSLSNIVEDARYFWDTQAPWHAYRCYYHSTEGHKVYLHEEPGHYVDYSADPDLDTVYYLTIERDEGVGSYGQLNVYICTGNYYGESGANLVETLSITLHVKQDFRYIFAGQSYNSGSSEAADGYVEDLDLQEEAAADHRKSSFFKMLQ